jgi:alpha-tubulin suppressor-like RCC1 family protein
MSDNAGPIIIKKSGPITNARTANPNDTLVYAITDQSGIDSVSWTLNKGASIVLTPETNGQYSIKAVLVTYRTNTIIITATDKSPAHNKSSDTTVLDYNVAPKANEQNLSTKKNTALSITLTADAIDGDTLSGWVVVTPPTNCDLSGTAPGLTYTPKLGFVGFDSLAFTVSDGKNISNTAKIKINVSDALIAPIAGKTIVDISANKGQAAAFVATVNADANPSPVFSWFKDGGSTSLSANQTYTIAQTSYSAQGRYRYLVSNSQGKDTSNWIALTVKDITKPVIVLKGANPQMILVGTTYAELGDSAYDDKDGVITSKVVIDISKVKNAQIGTYPVTYAVKDSSGNIADTVTRSVQINGNAPNIGKISGNKETCINVPAIFSVSATGSQPLKYQWMKGTAAAPGKNTDSIYSIIPISIADAGSFYCIVSNGISPDAQSQNMTLTVDSPPAITGIAATPSTMPVCAGTQVAFTVTANGAAPLTYSWKKNGAVIANASNNATYTITAVAASDSGQYSCIVSNGCSPAATSTNVQLSVKLPPTISVPTANTTVSKSVGDTVTLTVTAAGTGTLSYQWYKGSSTIGTNSSAFPIKPVALTDSGAYTCVVSNGCGNVTSKVITVTVGSRPSITTQPLSQTLYLGQSATFSVVATGVPKPTFQWRKNGGNISGATNVSYTISSPGINDSGKYTVAVTNSAGAVVSDTARFYAGFKSTAAGGNHSLILKTDGTLWACGDNTYGQLGDGTTTSHSAPVQVKSIANVQSVAAGYDYSLILKNDGTIWACGNNVYGQLGDGTTNSRSTPVQILTVSNFQGISAGDGHSLFLKTDGTVLSCGYNSNGQLGDGTTINRSTPILVTGINSVKSVTAGGAHSLILRIDGTVWACGNNNSGQLGDSTTTDRLMLVQITSINNVQQLFAGGNHSIALKTDGTVWTWGLNSSGQLGNGTTNSDSIPLTIPGISGIQNISAGGSHSLILKNDGTLWAFGDNSSSQLGDGTKINRYVPIQIASISNVQSVSAGMYQSLILKVDRSLWACGSNFSGQLGDGTTTERSTPIHILF